MTSLCSFSYASARGHVARRGDRTIEASKMTSTSLPEKEQLTEDISRLAREDAAPPDGDRKGPIDDDRRLALMKWAETRRTMAQKTQRLELILEEERVRAVMQDLDELNPQVRERVIYLWALFPGLIVGSWRAGPARMLCTELKHCIVTYISSSQMDRSTYRLASWTQVSLECHTYLVLLEDE